MKVTVTALALTLTLVSASTARAAAITINTLPGTTYTTGGVTDVSTQPSQMNGMNITAFWSVNGVQFSQTQAWNSGVSFSASNFALAVNGDTLSSNAWNLDFSANGTGLLQKLVFNGVPGNTVFDRSKPNKGTPGSEKGKDLDGFDQYCHIRGPVICRDQGDITATYFNQVVLNGSPFAGDLYAGIQIEFLSDGGLGEGTNWNFSLDTDIANTQLVPVLADPVTPAVPEPASLVLLGTGLLGVAKAARRRAPRQS